MKASSNVRKNSSSTSASTQKIGRPINCFMAFRLEKHREISSQSPGLNHRDISKIIAKWWKEATDIEKAPYRAIAEKAKAEHAKKYPNYKYKPVKKSERKVRPYHRRENAATQLLKQWLGEEDDEETDSKSEASFHSSSTSSSSSSCSMKTQPFFDDASIKHEPIRQEHYSLFSSPLCQPMFYDNFIYDNEMIPTDAISDCTLPSSQFNTVDLVPEFSSLELFNIPDYVNLQMLSLDNSSFML
ncbi:high mobility group box domain-containing protein [Absidia repens]|uniref:High mobility group box domain-containing protein n=1 Tax=Absidia repens TaxID=90262 RepID=A0A1X2IVU0_9FUNG|nr:high mobility group box domain-containing protein [Absidia repens]